MWERQDWPRKNDTTRIVRFRDGREIHVLTIPQTLERGPSFTNGVSRRRLKQAGAVWPGARRSSQSLHLVSSRSHAQLLELLSHFRLLDLLKFPLFVE